LIVEWDGPTAPVVSVTTDATADSASVLVDGVLVATVQGTASLTASQITLVRVN
jgi:hypothetical protein